MAEPVWHKAFLEALKINGNVTQACDAAGVKHRTAYAARETNQEFARKWEQALEKAIDSLEAEAIRRARDGVEKGIWHNGERVGTELTYSDTLLIFLMKGHRPEKYRERYDVKHGGSIEVRTLADIAKEVSEDDD